MAIKNLLPIPPQMWPFWEKKFKIARLILLLSLFFKKKIGKNVDSTRGYGRNSVFLTTCFLWNVDKSLWQSVKTSLSCYIPSLFRHAILSQPDHATIFLRCCHIFRGKAKAIELLFCTKEIGKEKTRKLLWQRLDWQEKGILAKVVKDTQRQLNPAAVVMPDDCVAIILWLPSLPLRVRRRVLLFVVFVPVISKFVHREPEHFIGVEI